MAIVSEGMRCCIRRWKSKVGETVHQWIQQYRAVLFLLIFLQVAAYGYFYTIPILTNHTFPNVWLNSYPSYRTLSEGRWMADLIVAAQGGSGVPSFQMICATILQALNGILLARFAGLTSRRATGCIAAVFCMYPAFLDYYSFSIDHLTFVLGDTFALIGAWNFIKRQKVWSRIGGSALFFLMSIAAYPPKIGLVAFFACSALLLCFSKKNEKETVVTPWREAFSNTLSMAVTVMLALGIYWITIRMTVSGDSGLRTHLNAPAEIIREIMNSYAATWRFFTTVSTGLPPVLRFVPALGIALGVTSILLQTGRKHWLMILPVGMTLLLIPVALRASYVINSFSWACAGRIVAVNGYCFVFFLASGLRTKVIRTGCSIIAVICLYFFTVFATQQSNASAMKTIYDLNVINRIAFRAENVLGTFNGTSRALVIAGNYPEFNRREYVKYPDGQSHAHVSTSTFETYRQVEILNFFLGKNVFRRPTKAELNWAVESMSDKAPWPADESVYLFGETLVILLEPYRPEIPITWTSD